MKESDLVNVPGCTDFETYPFCTVFSTLNSKTQQYKVNYVWFNIWNTHKTAKVCKTGLLSFFFSFFTIK